MSRDNESILLLEEIIQPRTDWFAIEQCLSMLVNVVHCLTYTGNELWNIDALKNLHTQLENKALYLVSKKITGPKGIYGNHPIHGALYYLTKNDIKSKERTWLLSHVINAAYQWRKELIDVEERADTRDKIEALKNQKVNYQHQLESACKVVRLVEEDRLDFLPSLEKPTANFSLSFRKKTREYLLDDENIQNRYFKELARFFSYADNPRKSTHRKEKTARKSKVLTKISFTLGADDDEAVSCDLSGRSAHFLVTEETQVDDDGVPETTDRQDEIRSYGLSPQEEKAGEAFQSRRNVSPRKGDSAMQAILRSRAQLQHRAKSSQLLPERWEQLGTFDIQRLRHAVDSLDLSEKQIIKPLIIMILITGRPLEEVLESHVVEGHHQIPDILREGTLYFSRVEKTWSAKTFSPEGRRQVKSAWKEHMREADDRLTLFVPDLFWKEIAGPIGTRGVKKRSVAIFDEQEKSYIGEAINSLIGETRKSDGSRLTLHRLCMHLFNILNRGSHDIADTCLISGRLPPFGQQSSLYYYAPRKAHLQKRYHEALEVIAKQLSQPGEEVPLSNKDKDEDKTQRSPTLGSEIVPQFHYIKSLVKHLLTSVNSAQSSLSGIDAVIELHNRFTAYVIAMLMFSTGYRSVRDPVPKEHHINLRRNVIIIADKVDDSQYHARMLPLPPMMTEQYHHYVKHRRHLAGQLGLFLSQQWKTPFFFLDSYANPVEVTPRRLQEKLNWPENPPLNINRHFLRTHLREAGAPGEYVDAFMGHWDSGQEPWERYSTFCPRHYRRQVAGIVNGLLVEQGWQITSGAVS